MTCFLAATGVWCTRTQPQPWRPCRAQSLRARSTAAFLARLGRRRAFRRSSTQFVEHVAPSVTLPRATLAATLSEDRRHLYATCSTCSSRACLCAYRSSIESCERAYSGTTPHRRRVAAAYLEPRRTDEQWQPIGSIEAFRVLRDGVEVEGASYRCPLALIGCGSTSEYLSTVKPTTEAEWRPQRLVFAARAPGPYVLAIGHPNARFSPVLNAASMSQPTILRAPACRSRLLQKEASL